MAEVVEEQDARHDAEGERQDDDHEVLRLEAQRVLGEPGPEHPQDADQRRRDPEVDERPGDAPVRPDEGDALAQLAEGRAHRLLGLLGRSVLRLTFERAGRGRRGQGPAEARGDQVADAHDEDQGRCPEQRDHERSQEREADGERRVEGEREDAVGREELPAWHDLRDHRRLRGGEEHGHRGDQGVEQDQEQEVRPAAHSAMDSRARSTFVPTRTSRLSNRST